MPEETAASSEIVALALPKTGAMGLKGIWGLVGNASAMLLVCVMFYTLQSNNLEQQREDRKLFREELLAIRGDNRDNRDQTRAILQRFGDLQADMKDLGINLAENQRQTGQSLKAISSMQQTLGGTLKSIEELTREMKAVKNKEG